MHPWPAAAAAVLLAAGCGTAAAPGAGGSAAPDLAPAVSATATASPTATPAATATAVAAGTATVGTASAAPAASRSVVAGGPPPTAAPPPANPDQLSESSSGQTVTLHVGGSARVSLPADYDPPTASSDVLVRTSASGGYPSSAPVDAVFRAVRDGQADLRSQTDAGCLHTTPRCMIAQREWVVHVVVTG